MSVYVDDAYIPWRGSRYCHMAADSIEELQAMAERIGLKRNWFQAGRLPHYDISPNKRALALHAGAVAVDCKQLVKLIKESEHVRNTSKTEAN